MPLNALFICSKVLSEDRTLFSVLNQLCRWNKPASPNKPSTDKDERKAAASSDRADAPRRAQAPATAFEKAIRSRAGTRDDDDAAAAAAPPPEPAAEEEEEEDDDDDEADAEARYESARRGFAADEGGAQDLVRSKKRSENVRWRERDAKRKAGRLPHRQRETCSRLHRDGARQSKRRERARAARESEELASLASGKFRMTGKSKALARHVQPRGRAGASIHERLHLSLIHI